MDKRNKCLSCKYCVLGPYSEKYGGRPIGCERPEEVKTKYGADCKWKPRKRRIKG